MKILLELILLLPLCGAVLQVLLGGMLPRRGSETMACAAVWGSFGATLGAASLYTAPARVEIISWLADFELAAPVSLYLDPLSLAIILMVTFVCGLIHLYSVAYMADDPGHVRFFALLNLFVAAMLLLVLAENLPLLYLGWEGVGFCSYGLIGYWYREEKNATAARKAFIVTRVGDIALGIAIVWFFQLFGTMSISVLNESAFLMPVGMVITPLGILLLVGAMGKSAQLPLSVWLPDAMAGPTPVSALIHAATMVTAGVYLLMRLFPFFSASTTVLAAIAVTGALSAFYGASCALVQRDLKRVLAYSTISQIGFMMLGVGAGAISAATFHLIVHAFFKALLFLGAGCVITLLHHEQDLYRMGGVRASRPATFRLFLAGALCLAGFPLTGGFFSKDAILAAVWGHGGSLYAALYLLALLTAFLTAFYTFRMVWLVFGGEKWLPPFEKGGGGGLSANNGQIPLAPPLAKGEVHGAIPRLMELTLVPLALLGLGGGLLNLPAWLGEGVLTDLLAPVSGAPHHLAVGTDIALQLVAALVAVGGILLAGYRYGDSRRAARLAEGERPAAGVAAFLLHGWYLDRLYDLLIVRPFTWASAWLWQRVDEGMIDGSADRFAAFLGWSGEFIGRWTSGRVSLYLLSFAAGAALLVGWLVWGGVG